MCNTPPPRIAIHGKIFHHNFLLLCDIVAREGERFGITFRPEASKEETGLFEVYFSCSTSLRYAFDFLNFIGVRGIMFGVTNFIIEGHSLNSFTEPLNIEEQ